MNTTRAKAAKPCSRRRPRRRLWLEELEARNCPSIFTPGEIRHAYGFDQVSATGAGQTIAIVDAFDDPNAAADLQKFSSQFGLAAASFTKATPFGTPKADAGWSTEIALDTQWAHATAPGANILLVEALSSTYTDLLNAVDWARHQTGVSVVSMSWGGSEFSGQTALDSIFTTPSGHNGVTFVASSGDDSGWNGPEWPSSSTNVLSVGGTTLKLTSTGNYSSETAWSGSGGGYSSYEREPSYQTGVQHSGARTTPDVSFNANPNSGYYVYQSYGTTPGWYQVGGTSAGAPQWAALVALANQERAAAGKSTLDGPSQTIPTLYSMSASNFQDVSSGSNGYAAHTGYDLATGRGTPKVAAVIHSLVSVSTAPTPSPTGNTASSSTGATPRVAAGTGRSAAPRAAVDVQSTSAATPTQTDVSPLLTLGATTTMTAANYLTPAGAGLPATQAFPAFASPLVTGSRFPSASLATLTTPSSGSSTVSAPLFLDSVPPDSTPPETEGTDALDRLFSESPSSPLDSSNPTDAPAVSAETSGGEDE
jgi:subtilase family serine protease